MICYLALLSLFLIFYAYFGYPLVLLFLATQKKREALIKEPNASALRVALIITVRNEETVIRKKLEESLSLLVHGEQTMQEAIAAGSAELIVASDCSDDSTDSIVQSFSDKGVVLVRLDERGGKERAQQAAIAASDTDIIVFTDAKISLNTYAIDNFLHYFADPEVGAVSSIDRVLSSDSGSSGEGLYVRYEMWLRQLESNFNSLVGLSGSCFAVRRDIATKLQVDIPSDFSLLLETQRQGLRGVHAPDVIGSYRAVKTEGEEFSRKVRTVLRGITACFSRAEILSPQQFGVFAWQVWSHKVARWLVPFFLIVSFLTSLLLAGDSSFFALVSLALLLLFGAALLGLAESSFQKIPLVKACVFFCVVNAAIAVAWIKYLSGQRSVAWNPSAKQ